MSKKEKGKAKVYYVIAIFILFGVCLVSVSFFGNKFLSANRAYISGESEWAKAQKDATISILQYVKTEDERFYDSYMRSLQVINGDRMSRLELAKEDPDLRRVKRGFIMGNNHPDDIDSMIWLVRNFGFLDRIQEALATWEEADLIIIEFTKLAEEIHNSIEKGLIDDIAKEEYPRQIIDIKDRLTIAGQSFSGAMNSAARTFGNVIFWINTLFSTTFIFITAYLSVSYMRDLRSANKKLFLSEYKFRNVLYHSRDVIYQINIGSHCYDYMSESVQEMLGLEAEEVMKGGPEMILSRIHPEDRDRMKKRQKQNEELNNDEGLSEDSEFRIKRADGSYIWVNNKRALVRDADGKAVAIVGNVRDISVKKHQMEKLDQSLHEKQTLLSEIHHRVKNNLAIVSSLIELQKDEVTPDLKPAFSDVQSRIKSIALIHEKLYEKAIFSKVEMADYLRELSELISDTYYSKEKKIEIELRLEDVKVNMTSAVPVGLICNELINNSFKHAFKNCNEGKITIGLKERGGQIEVTVCDSGVGLPDDFSLESSNSLGVTLLRVLTLQIEGVLKVIDTSGSKFVLQFPQKNKEYKKSEKDNRQLTVQSFPLKMRV